ncbi:XVIPCD domain-containing protein [Lysobacter rhizosphaerae]
MLSGGSSRPATAEELQSIGTMRQALSQLPVPTLQHRDNPHEYLFFALLDGTGQDLDNPKLGPPTNIGVLAKQADKLRSDPANRIATHYAKGIGSQSNGLIRAIDGMAAATWADGIEETYRKFANQAKKWIDVDPQAQIRVAGVGYSRGAVQTAGFLRLVDQYGVAQPADLKFGRDPHDNITVISPYPPLVPPGQVAQVAALFDPVATNMPHNYDARLPPSVISSVSFLAANEQRELFPHQAINDAGMTPDGRALSVAAPGGHSNIGGGNQEPGLEILVGNAMVDYLNRLRDEPLFEKRAAPDDPSMMSIYQAQGATAAFGLRMDHDGHRDLRDELANCKIVDPCRDSEPMNRALAGQFEYQRSPVDPKEEAQLQGLVERVSHRAHALTVEPARDPARVQADALVAQYLAAVKAGDEQGMRAATMAFAKSERGEQLFNDAQERTLARLQQLPGRDHPLFEQAMQHLERLGPATAGYLDRAEMEGMAGAIAYQAKRSQMPAIDDLVPTHDGRGLVATWTHPIHDVFWQQATVDKLQAATQPLDQSLQQLADETQRQAQMEMQRTQERAQQQHVGRSR